MHDEDESKVLTIPLRFDDASFDGVRRLPGMRLALAVIVAALVAPVANAGTTPAAKTANDFCKANKAALVGPGKAYKNHGQCLKAQKAVSGAEAKNAATACKAELADPSFAAAHGGKSFQEHYGTNGAKGVSKGKGKGNAYGKCVSAKAREGKSEAQASEVNAAKLCKTWRSDDAVARAALGGLTFAQKYGTAKNAFGKCVSAQKVAGEDD